MRQSLSQRPSGRVRWGSRVTLMLMAVVLALNSDGCVAGNSDHTKLLQYRELFASARDAVFQAREKGWISARTSVKLDDIDQVALKSMNRIEARIDAGETLGDAVWSDLDALLWDLQEQTPTVAPATPGPGSQAPATLPHPQLLPRPRVAHAGMVVDDVLGIIALLAGIASAARKAGRTELTAEEEKQIQDHEGSSIFRRAAQVAEDKAELEAGAGGSGGD